MSFTRPTLVDVAGAFTGVAGSPACMSNVGVTGRFAESLANWIRPLAEQLKAFDVIGTKPSRGLLCRRRGTRAGDARRRKYD